MSQKRNQIAESVPEHAWNKERSMCAAAVGKSVIIYDATDDNPRKWKKLHTLDDHTLTVSSLDWHQESGNIVTCSHDRNAFVWKYDESSDKWHPNLVILRVDRAANQVRFSPDGKKFAVASSAKKVPVCHFEPEQKWWVSQMIKKHKSTVLSLGWHPNSQIIATGSCDFRCRVFSCYVDLDNVDAEQDNGPFNEGYPFGELIAEFDCKGWVEAVAWSPGGTTLAYCGHDSSITFVDFEGGEASSQTIKCKCLPFRDCKFVTDTRLLAAGYDFNPMLFDKKDGLWVLDGDIDDEKQLESEKKKGNTAKAFHIFHHLTETGKKGAEDKIKTKHDNTITCIREFETSAGQTKYSTSGIDGRVHFWDIPHEGGDED
jgi:actin related protein 2/3 complex subunit 1A/1B